MQCGAAMRSLPLLTVGLAFAAACTQSPSTPEEQQLESALHTWSGQGSLDYAFTWQRQCYCGPEDTQPIRISVENDTITSAIYIETELPVDPSVADHLLTIDGLFAHIQDAIANGADAVNVEYHPTVGHPVSVAIDYDAALADEELAVVISDLVFSPPINGL